MAQNDKTGLFCIRPRDLVWGPLALGAGRSSFPLFGEPARKYGEPERRESSVAGHLEVKTR
ncbi:hypothetical protein FHS21_003095 [Phyllobacterium trifolii]|uniref:Uncharacterized protein n=1 Tax=Phyllobacterium trifolii TaxID=300193 RepID=A0A839UE51_9HYPH|nr:hypothetical protein [Phyllobacterium trifolii]MBB3146679.1 hypothetical protein [Phyllobacterium trifolii]